MVLPSIPLDPELIISKVLEKVYDHLFAECVDKILSEDIPGEMQELAPRKDVESIPTLPPMEVVGDRGKEVVPKSTPSTPLSISSDSDAGLEGEEIVVETGILAY